MRLLVETAQGRRSRQVPVVQKHTVEFGDHHDQRMQALQPQVDIRGGIAEEMPQMPIHQMEPVPEHVQVREVRSRLGLAHPEPKDVPVVQEPTVERTHPLLDLPDLLEARPHQEQHPHQPVSRVRQEPAHQRLQAVPP